MDSRNPLKRVARPAGLEPATPSLEGSCSIPLSYGRYAICSSYHERSRVIDRHRRRGLPAHDYKRSFGNSSSTRPLGRRCFARCSGVGRYTPAMKGGLCLLQKRSIFPKQSTKLRANSSWRAFPIIRNRPTPSRITACLSFGLKRIRLSLEIANQPLAPTLCNQTSSGVDSSENSSSCFTTQIPAFDKMRGNNTPRSRSVKNITFRQLVRRLLPLLLR